MYTLALPDQKTLINFLEYNKDTGELFWKFRSREFFKNDKAFNFFNRQFADKKIVTIKNGYKKLSINGKTYSASRIIWKMVYGEDPIHVDHIDNDSLNDCLENLRNVTISDNNKNRVKSKNKKSNLPKGVTFRPKTNKYRAQIKVDGTKIDMGYFDTMEEAYLVYCKAVKYYHKEFANYDPDYPIDVDSLDDYVPKNTSYITNIMDYTFAFECFDYDPASGIMKYKARPLHHFDGDIVRMSQSNIKAGRIVNSPATSGLRATIDKKPYYVHRLAVLLMTGENPEYLVEHIDGDKTNNAWKNLKIINKFDKTKAKKTPLADLPIEYIVECIDVDHITGITKFKERPLHHFRNENIMKSVNSQCAGKIIDSINSHGYIRFTINGSTYLLHRVLHKLKVGYDDPNLQIDHIDGDKLNNTFDNLRFATNVENTRNRSKPSSNTSGAKGVSKLKNGKFRAQIKIDGKPIHLGTFSTLSNASDAYNDAALRYFGEFARK